MERILAFAGGKGGTGKSSLALAFADRYAKLGRTVVVDLDLGASNIHTMVGIHTPPTGISEFLLKNPENKPLNDFTLNTKIENLDILSSNSVAQGSANIEYQRKQKILKGIHSLNYDTIILDIGAGTSYNTIDFFDEANFPIIVATPDLTSIINAYEFLKNHLFRKFKKNIKPKTNAAHILEKATKTGKNSFELMEIYQNEGENESAELIRKLCTEDEIYMIINRQKEERFAIGDKLKVLAKQFLNIDLLYLDNIMDNSTFSKAIIKGVPVTQLDSKLADQIDTILLT